jgi:hypothetical protein
MAEIRKYDPAQGNAIVEALRSAMGEPVRPLTPGEKRAASNAEPPTATTSTVINLTVTTGEAETETH